MRVFVTGGTGWIGTAVVPELIGAGHQVIGLARSDTAAAVLTAAGAQVHRGALDDPDSLRAAAGAADGVIHLAFNNSSETTDFATAMQEDAMQEDAMQEDLCAVETIGSALENSGKPFVVTSGTLVLATLGRFATEEDEADPALPRVEAEKATIALAERGVRSSVICNAPTVHGEGDKAGFVTTLIGIARAKGVSAYVRRRNKPLARGAPT